MPENIVQLEIFEGPLDLLLYLVKKEEVDIYEVNLTKIATQFIDFIEQMRQLDLDIAGEFLVMASTLMYIKSRELLPVDKQAVVDDEDNEDDPRWDLIRQLVEYKKFKDAAGQLQVKEALQENVFARVPGKPDFEPEANPRRLSLSVFEIIGAVSSILKRYHQREESRDVFADRWTVSEKIESIIEFLKSKTVLQFSELFGQATSRVEVVVTFLALLELIRLKQVRVTQPEPFSEIEITEAPPEVVPMPQAGNGSVPPSEMVDPNTVPELPFFPH